MDTLACIQQHVHNLFMLAATTCIHSAVQGCGCAADTAISLDAQVLVVAALTLVHPLAPAIGCIRPVVAVIECCKLASFAVAGNFACNSRSPLSAGVVGVKFKGKNTKGSELLCCPALGSCF